MRRLIRSGLIMSVASVAWRNRESIKGWFNAR
jgi:hypothetical protein